MLTIEGLGAVKVIDAIKVGKCVLHEIETEVPDELDLVGKTV